MENDAIVLNLIVYRKNNSCEEYDLEVPTFISANELIIALNYAYKLGFDLENVKTCYLKTEFPTALLRGTKSLQEFGLMNGTKIVYVEGENQ